MSKKNKNFPLFASVVISMIALGVASGFFCYYGRTEINFQKGKKQTTKEYHYSFVQKEQIEEAFAKIKKTTPIATSTKGIIINHHLLAINLMAKIMSVASSSQIRTVILVSPNHFMVGHGPAIASAEDWQTPYGVLPADQDFLAPFVKSGLIAIDEAPFVQEHGVANVIPFIKRQLPQAKVVPIILKDNIADRQLMALADLLAQKDSDKILVIASLDFSHYLSLEKANAYDRETEKILNTCNYVAVDELNADRQPNNVDSKPTLKLFLILMCNKYKKSFHLMNNSNSAIIIGDKKLPETTSYFTGWFN
ncbi:MAG: AmmeMemoRadiSam system protein B [Patescibacteria group bacterium]